MVPTCPSWVWKLHSKGCSPGAVTVNSIALLSPGASSGISAEIGSGPLVGGEAAVVGPLRGHAAHRQPDLPRLHREVIGGEDVVVLGLQRDLLHAVGGRGDPAEVRVGGRRRRGRPTAVVPAAANQHAAREDEPDHQRSDLPHPAGRLVPQHLHRGPKVRVAGPSGAGSATVGAASSSSPPWSTEPGSPAERAPGTGSGRTSRASHGSASPAASRTASSRPAVKPHTTMSATPNAGPM